MSSIPGVQNDLPVTICQDAADAVVRGFNYQRPEYLPARLSNAVIVLEGTVSGKPTVDLIFQDETGQKHVMMLTAKLVQWLADLTRRAS